MARLTRAESQARTREHVLETAYTLFLRDGFATTSMDRVAEAAGYSKGAVYSNFATKNELCLAVLDRIVTEQMTRLTAELDGTHRVDDRIAGFARWAEQHIGDSPWTSLEVEFATATRRDKDVCRQLAARRRKITEGVAELIEAQAREFGLTLSMPADIAAVTLLSLGIGLGVQRAFDPSVPVEPLVDLLYQVMRGMG
ncbi:TetR/AcrR family transcriptional regulator [Streptomyces sp. NA04227]|uniref:TetR/AcrR family transcriptional regulator n=1 Tax=Streptomyces sp. NA04227 TaxID=2742136 RepID=UPI0015928654|nr:TetR/AcrR family transcriptional regulator [Streptomyces sp. NA04227]QKW08417.1 TetR/AcrR family transcriptional regulator [Streptomyces sp. NA04227]